MDAVKMYVTKPPPLCFVAAGYERFKLWFGAKPEFKESSVTTVKGHISPDISDWTFREWQGTHELLFSMDGKQLLGGDQKSPLLSQRIWESVVSSYRSAEDTNANIYSSIMDAYYADNYVADNECYKSMPIEAKRFLEQSHENRFRAAAVEREGQGFHELVLEYDIAFSVRPPQRKPNTGWVTKSYTGNGFTLWYGVDSPLFKRAIIIDPAFSSALKSEDVRPLEFTPISRCAKLELGDTHPLLYGQIKAFVDNAYIGGVDKGVRDYKVAKGRFEDRYKSLAHNVDSEGDLLDFANTDGLHEYAQFESMNGVEGLKHVWFADASPREVAKNLLEAMACTYARRAVDAEGYEESWIGAFSLGVDLISQNDK